jgi:hypothetical protein
MTLYCKSYYVVVIGYWLGGAVTCWLFALDEHIKVARYLALDSRGGTSGIDNIIGTLAGGLGSVVAVSHGRASHQLVLSAVGANNGLVGGTTGEK